MKAITRVNHIGIRVSDFETSRDFYAKLGFEYLTGPTGPEPVAIVEHPSGININFILNANQPETSNILMDVAEKHTGYTHVALEITDAASVIEELQKHGIELTGDMMHPTGRSIFIRDPDRNVVEFCEYKGLDSLQN
ncbi:Lactoylglutathione lyase [BD1-7 clade bacterium]|uniref:Lactoylglutathione lyase n=1 Tax=BD1-7 clade bacterium TaxID=2029982 RepID=A0A5S9PHK7_9GAMM|nr:Lactoylglutathione lyase [BD1-7 clade bacterium]CAA0103471.1 Lactoylglutathione lyase [BD1-7 clade bacterium]